LDKKAVAALEKVGETVSSLEKSGREATTALEAAQAQIAQLTERLASLEKPAPEPDPDVPDSVRLQLEAQADEIKLLRQERQKERDSRIASQIAFALENARKYVDKDGMGHSKPFMDLLGKGLRLEAFDFNGETIKLETGDYVSYFRNLLMEMAQAIPGQTRVKSQTEPENHDHNGPIEKHYTQAELEAQIERFKKFEA